MLDPVTITADAALTEGVKFLYEQLTDLLRRHRTSKNDQDEELGLPGTSAGTLDEALPPMRVPRSRVGAAANELGSVRRELADFVDGLRPVSTADIELMEMLARARGLLENVYGCYLTFPEERLRPHTGTTRRGSETVTQAKRIFGAGDASIAAERIAGAAATSGAVAVHGNVHGNITVTGEVSAPGTGHDA